jgi:phosphatidylserine/phosphatidylglycerophosphate/cardiolipin synthase-like enzyme
VTSSFHALPTAALRALAEALRTGHLKPPVTGAALGKAGLSHVPGEAAGEVQRLLDEGHGAASLAWGLERLVVERELQQAVHRAELVWTGPEAPGAGSRDTSVVVRELLDGAERSVLISTFAIYQGAQVFRVLAERMAARPELSVRMFVNVHRPPASQASETQLLWGFARRFREEDWPSHARLPELFYDPRALASAQGPRAVPHAKCIVVDDCRAFVSSANFTEAAQERNIEAGVLVSDPAFARALRDQFESLVAARLLLRVPVAQEGNGFEPGNRT